MSSFLRSSSTHFKCHGRSRHKTHCCCCPFQGGLWAGSRGPTTAARCSRGGYAQVLTRLVGLVCWSSPPPPLDSCCYTERWWWRSIHSIQQSRVGVIALCWRRRRRRLRWLLSRPPSTPRELYTLLLHTYNNRRNNNRMVAAAAAEIIIQV